MKVLVATDKPFAKVAVDGIRKEIEAAGYELVLLEILQIEYFIQCTRTIEIVKFTVGSVQCLGHVHNLRTQWSHTCLLYTSHAVFLLITTGQFMFFDDPVHIIGNIRSYHQPILGFAIHGLCLSLIHIFFPLHFITGQQVFMQSILHITDRIIQGLIQFLSLIHILLLRGRIA